MKYLIILETYSAFQMHANITIAHIVTNQGAQ